MMERMTTGMMTWPTSLRRPAIVELTWGESIASSPARSEEADHLTWTLSFPTFL